MMKNGEFSIGMSVPGIQETIAHVRELQQAVLERRRFKGYSGRIRITMGFFALVAAAVMASPAVPESNRWHVIGWGIVFIVAFVLNAGAVIWWFWKDPVTRRDVRVLKPTLDVIAPIAVGGLLTAAMILNRQYEYLFGIWMCLFGLTNMASRMVLPRAIWWVGAFYIAAGAICLLAPEMNFQNPWPMGIIFCAGEVVGGVVLHYDGTRNVHTNAREGVEKNERTVA